MELVVRQQLGKLRTTVTDADGVAATPDAATVTIARDSDGEVIADDAAAAINGQEISYTLQPSDLPSVDLLSVTWTLTVAGTEITQETQAGVVGAHICSLEQIEAAVGAVASPGTAALRDARAEAETLLERACNVAFRPSYARETLTGNGNTELLVGRPRLLRALSAAIDGETISVAEVSPTVAGTLVREEGWPCGSEIELTYEHGWPVPPKEVVRAAVKLAREFVLVDPSNFDQRAGRIETAEAVYGFMTQPGGGVETSIPEVNAVIEAYREPVVG